MFTDLKPYPEYAESCVTWLGPFPVHWNVRRAKYLFRDIDVRSKTGHQQQLSVSHLTGVSPRSMKTITMFKAVSYVGHKACLAGDLVVNTMWAWMGALGIAREAGIVSPAYNVYRPLRTSGVNVEFVAVLFRTPTYIAYFRSHSRGLRPSRLRFYPDELLATPALLPPWDEQAAIVKYLGHANARIDRAIAAKRKLIALLEEQKQAIIKQSVTRGLVPDAPMTDSGIPWLGEIPTGWGISRLGWLISLQTGYPFESLGYTTDESAIRLLRGVNVGTGYLQWSEVVRWPSQDGTLGNYALEVGDIVLGMDRPVISGGIRVTRIGVDDVPSLLVQRVARIRPDIGLPPEYLLHLLSGGAFADYLRPIFTGISVPHLSPQQINHFEIPMPPVAEQRRIVESLASATAEVNETRAKVSREIELLREFRTRLTADIVTGQVDIRAAAARLPELDRSDLVSDVEQDEDGLDAEIAESLAQVDA